MAATGDRVIEAPETTHHARVVWKGTKQDLRAHEVTLGDQTISGSASGSLGGDATKSDPEEMLVAALSTCHMLWFLDFARRERLRVTSYEDKPEGTMDGVRFTRVVLRPRIEFEQDPTDEVVEALHHRAHERCFIANTVSCPVEVEAP